MPKMQLSKPERIVSPRRVVGFIVAVAIFALLASSVVELYRKHRAIRLHISDLKNDKISLEQKYTSIRDLNDRIETVEGKEYVLRDKYRLVRPGEGLIVVTAPETTLDTTKAPALQRFWHTLLRAIGIGV